VGKGKWWLRADLQVACAGAEYDAVRALALVAIVVFVLGVPLALSVAMHHRRDAIRRANEGKESAVSARDRASASSYRFLFQPYSPRFFGWEALIMLRKAALVAVLSFVPAEQGDLRVYIGLGVLQIPLLLQAFYRPFRTALQNRLESFALIATFLTLFVGQAISLEILPKPEQQGGAAGEDAVDEELSKNVALALVTLVNAGVVLVMAGVVGAAWRRHLRAEYPEESAGVACLYGAAQCCGCGVARDGRRGGGYEEELDWDAEDGAGSSSAEDGGDGEDGGEGEARRGGKQSARRPGVAAPPVRLPSAAARSQMVSGGGATEMTVRTGVPERPHAAVARQAKSFVAPRASPSAAARAQLGGSFTTPSSTPPSTGPSVVADGAEKAKRGTHYVGT